MRPREPSALQELKGNSSSRRQRKGFKAEAEAEPQPPAACTDVPEELIGDTYAEKEWKRLAPELARLNMLTILDVKPLAAYCRAYSQWRELCSIWSVDMVSEETARGARTMTPETKAMLELYRVMHQYIVQLGLSPSARTRVRVDKPQHLIDPKPKNDFFTH